MKKFLFSVVFVTTFLLVSCSNGGSTKENASSTANRDCSFVLSPPLDYGDVTGVALSGVIYVDGVPSNTVLWMGKDLYDRTIAGKDSLETKILTGKCLYVGGVIHENYYFVYLVK
jgi:hypothetical protein